MEISIESLLEGAQRARGAVAVVDGFRAFTTAAVALSRGAEKIIMVGTVEEALAMRQAGFGQICMGEVDGYAVSGFDFGNSPFGLSTADVAGKTILQRTSAGTQGIVAAEHAERLYAAALVTASATARALRAGSPARVSLVAMGNRAVSRADEDELCAIHLRNLLEDRRGDPEAMRRVILAGGDVGDFADAHTHLHPRDIEIALDVDRYDFAVRVTREDGRLTARAESASTSPA